MCFVYDGDWGYENCGYMYEDCNGYDLKDKLHVIRGLNPLLLG